SVTPKIDDNILLKLDSYSSRLLIASHKVDVSDSGTLQLSRITGIIFVPLDSLLTILAFSSSRTHGLLTLKFDKTIITASASLRPSSNILSTRLSPGSISHLSNQASTPFSLSLAANLFTNRS